MKDNEKDIENFIKQFQALSPDAKRAICLIAENMDIIEKMAGGAKIPDYKMEHYIKKATEKRDYVLLAILLYKQKKDRTNITKPD
jgi:hypothetical protein